MLLFSIGFISGVVVSAIAVAIVVSLVCADFIASGLQDRVKKLELDIDRLRRSGS